MKLNYEIEITKNGVFRGFGEVGLSKNGGLELRFLWLSGTSEFIPDSINDKVFSSINEGLHGGFTGGGCEGFRWVLKHSE